MNEIADHTRIVSVAEMQRLEKEADAAGQTYATMMEQAGTALAEAIQESFPGSADQSVLVLVGPGNNGGDGLVCARHLSDAGYRVRVYLWARGAIRLRKNRLEKEGRKRPRVEKPGHRRTTRAIWARFSNAMCPRTAPTRTQMRCNFELGWTKPTSSLTRFWGTGANRPIEGALAGILQQLTEVRSRRLPPARTKAGEVGSATASETGGPEALSPLTVVAVDVPSGLNADSGAPDPATVAADMTVTFGCAKAGQFLFPGAAVLGELVWRTSASLRNLPPTCRRSSLRRNRLPTCCRRVAATVTRAFLAKGWRWSAASTTPARLFSVARRWAVWERDW